MCQYRHDRHQTSAHSSQRRGSNAFCLYQALYRITFISDGEKTSSNGTEHPFFFLRVSASIALRKQQERKEKGLPTNLLDLKGPTAHPMTNAFSIRGPIHLTPGSPSSESSLASQMLRNQTCSELHLCPNLSSRSMQDPMHNTISPISQRCHRTLCSEFAHEVPAKKINLLEGERGIPQHNETNGFYITAKSRTCLRGID